VGQPIVLKFTQAITDPAARARLLSHLDTSLSTPVPVGGYWFSDTELHLRPENFWPSGEQVTFSDSLDGWDAGGGMWGQDAGTVQFTIGDARVSTANLATHEMTVTDNGNVVATYPISAGSTQYPTMTGTHIVLDRASQVRMISSTVGIPVNSPGGYDETVYWDVRVSDSGEYVHAAPWSVSAQGFQNVSHGCINLSPTSAEQFFGISRIGDIVNVVGGPRPPVPGDHGVMDGDTPWSSFTPISINSHSAQSAGPPHAP
jgi:lipoprotein-anchoring transpeptidase ErfK/SrfK